MKSLRNRKPRVLSISSDTPASSMVQAGQANRGRTEDAPPIPISEVRRIKTWVRYGMTLSQVAHMYGVAVGDVEGVLRKN